jgi:hypothetical protein
MNKLQLKEIVGYLPYGIKAVDDFGKARIIDWECQSYTNTIVGLNHVLHSQSVQVNCFKPILFPLSNFKSENIDDIKEYLGIGQWCDHYDYYFHAWFDDAESVNKLVLQAPYEVMEFFFLNHYDVFGLIEKDLAIAVTKDFNPYN